VVALEAPGTHDIRQAGDGAWHGMDGGRLFLDVTGGARQGGRRREGWFDIEGSLVSHALE